MIPFFSGETCWNFCRACSTETATFDVEPASTWAEHPLTIFKESNAEFDAPCCGNRRSPYCCCHDGGSLSGHWGHNATAKQRGGAGFTSPDSQSNDEDRRSGRGGHGQEWQSCSA